MLVLVAITPHSPLSIPTIGKEYCEKLIKTITAYGQLKQQVLDVQPDMFVVISPHGKSIQTDAFTVNITHPEELNTYQTNFEEFGEYTTKLSFKNSPDFIEQILELKPEIPVLPVFDEILDHGTSIPLYYLTEQTTPRPTIVPLGYSGLSIEEHLNFGKALVDILNRSNKRIMVIISADLAHTLSEEAPAGYHVSGKVFDQQVRDLLKQRNLSELSQLNKQMVDEAVSCGYRSLLILSGILENQKYNYTELSYEAPFGVGYLTSLFEIIN